MTVPRPIVRELIWTAVTLLLVGGAVVLLSVGHHPDMRTTIAVTLLLVAVRTYGAGKELRGRRTATTADIEANVLREVDSVLRAEAESWRTADGYPDNIRETRAGRYEMAAAFLRRRYDMETR